MEIQGFLEIEKRYNLNQISVADVNYWNYVRFSVWNYMICAESLGLKEAHKKKHYGLAGKISVIGTLLKNSFSRNRVPANEKLDICYNVIHKANEIEKLPETIYVYTENPHSIFSYQMILNRDCMQYDFPEESVEEAIVFSEQKMEDDKCDIKYYCVQLAESEWLYVKGDI